MDNLDFYKEQLERIKKELTTEECFKDTQRYVNLTSVSTNLIGFVRQLEGIKKAEEERRKEEEEERRRKEETEQIISEAQAN
jgi:hypothetical protein